MQFANIFKFNPHHSPKDGKFTTGPGGDSGGEGGGGKMVDGVLHTSDVGEAAAALGKGQKVVLDSTKKVSTLLDKLADIVKDAEAKGEKAPMYDLCNVTVKGSNLFCVESKGIPRVKMPQLSGMPIAGSKADGLPKGKNGEVDLSQKFREHLAEKGVKIEEVDEFASYLKASQNELNGAKVAGMTRALRAGKLPGASIFVSKDNYVVDGHHRWAANVGVDADDGKLGDLKMPVSRVNMGIIELLALSNRFAHEWGIPQASVGQMRRDVPRKKCENCDKIRDFALGLLRR